MGKTNYSINLSKLNELKMKEIVLNHNGLIISGEYLNKHSEIVFKCKNNHVWKTQAQVILSGGWCRKCFFEKPHHLQLKDGLKQAQEIAQKRGGECLSDFYVSTKKKLNWKCKNGHIWLANLSDIKKGSWCPTCSAYNVREKICRHVIEKITGHSFNKARPKWLLNDRGNIMELDGYSPKLGLAFEHHGEQHYFLNEHFQRRGDTLEKRQIDDKKKESVCLKENVKLIIIPYYIKKIDIPEFIYNKLLKLNLDIKLNHFNNFRSVTNVKYDSNELQELCDISKLRGGKCLSPEYLGVNVKHSFICKEGHKFTLIPQNMKSKKQCWCILCAYKKNANKLRKYSLNDMLNLAKEKNGEFLSKTFKSVNDKYEWKCKEGHTWLATPADILRGRWCKKCFLAIKKYKLEDLKKIAEERGGESLAKVYHNNHEKLDWKCKNGHIFKINLSNVKNGHWCKYCNKL